MKVLVTGAGGFLGQGLVAAFEGRHELRLMDVRDWTTPHEKLIGSVADLETVRKAVAGCDGIVIAHMASVQAGSYETPEAPFDANVKGTVNLFFAAAEAGIRRVVLVSSTASIGGNLRQGSFATRDLPLRPQAFSGIYAMTKACQEVIAEYYSREQQMQVAVLRVGYILSADDPNHVVDKYGEHIAVRHGGGTERRDIGLAARLAMELPDLGYEVFYVISAPEGARHFDVDYTRTRLGWEAQHDFTWMPAAKAQEG
ncbi:MAG TPA: NAD(P)-dependent oxidoreductase [Phycisphaerae bacterium]|nr:NAD(P)-dependent oxidoreductase [Phycisphaerae bacterium]